MFRFGKPVLIALMIFLFFLLMSRIDYIVNGQLYNYGLRFSYDWGVGYWINYVLIYVAFAVILSTTYWMGSSRTPKDNKVAVALFLTISFLIAGGFQDVCFHVFWAGGLPSNTVVWWWVPAISLIGTWNSLDQLFMATLMSFCILVTWRFALRSTNPTKALNAKTFGPEKR